MNTAATKKDDYTMCCEAGADKRDDDDEITSGYCRIINKYNCPAPPKANDDEEDSNLPSSKPTAEQIKRGEV